MACSLFRIASASVLVLGAMGALGTLGCGSTEDSHAQLPSGGAGPGGSGGNGGGGTGGSDSDYLGMGGQGVSPECRAWQVPPVSASYLAAPDAGVSGANEPDAGTRHADGGTLDGGSAPDDAGANVALLRRVRVFVESALPVTLGSIAKLGAGVELLRGLRRSEAGVAFDVLVSTSQPEIDLSVFCDKGGGYVHLELVLHDASIDVIASKRDSLSGN